MQTQEKTDILQIKEWLPLTEYFKKKEPNSSSNLRKEKEPEQVRQDKNIVYKVYKGPSFYKNDSTEENNEDEPEENNEDEEEENEENPNYMSFSKWKQKLQSFFYQGQKSS